jgi:hypothetical protein
MDSTPEAVGWLDRHATYTRTGHHSARTGGGGTGPGGDRRPTLVHSSVYLKETFNPALEEACEAVRAH